MSSLVLGTAIIAAQGPTAPAEGIKVHGAWVIEVHNPDGALATRKEFTNDLTPNGGIKLVKARHDDGPWNARRIGQPGRGDQRLRSDRRLGTHWYRRSTCRPLDARTG